MRLQIIFKPEKNIFLIPTNYNYELSSIIYKIMSTSGPNFTKWLHSRGFSLEGAKRFKFFNFSRLFFQEKDVQGEVIKAKGNFKLIFSSPIDESVLTTFISGMMEFNKEIYLGNRDVGTKVRVHSINILPYPDFQYKSKYIMLSPTVATIQDENRKIVFLEPNNERTVDALRKNLVNKYETLFMEKCPYNIDFSFDENYINASFEKNLIKKVSIKASLDKTILIRGFMLPIELKSDVKIQKLAYETGIGEKNSLGFGMLEIAKK